MCSAVVQNGAREERIRADLLLVWIRMVDLAGNKTVPPRLGPPTPFKLVSLSTATNKKEQPRRAGCCALDHCDICAGKVGYCRIVMQSAASSLHKVSCRAHYLHF